MIYTKKTKQALQIMFDAHRDQKDKGGMPYVFHPFSVAMQMRDEDTTIVALLHDVIEDHPEKEKEIMESGFSENVYTALKLLTHNKNVPYMEYVEKIKENPVAKAVKIADLKQNSDLSRLTVITEEDHERFEKYKKAIEILEAD